MDRKCVRMVMAHKKELLVRQCKKNRVLLLHLSRKTVDTSWLSLLSSGKEAPSPNKALGFEKVRETCFFD